MKSSLREASTAELVQLLRSRRQELVMLRLKKEAGQLDKPHLIRKARKEIPQILSVLTLRDRPKS